jgi:hypothetical protein
MLVTRPNAPPTRPAGSGLSVASHRDAPSRRIRCRSKRSQARRHHCPENGQRTLWNSIRVTRSARPVVNVLRGGAEGEFTGIDLAEKHRSRSLAGGDTAAECDGADPDLSSVMYCCRLGPTPDRKAATPRPARSGKPADVRDVWRRALAQCVRNVRLPAGNGCVARTRAAD